MVEVVFGSDDGRVCHWGGVVVVSGKIVTFAVVVAFRCFSAICGGQNLLVYSFT